MYSTLLPRGSAHWDAQMLLDRECIQIELPASRLSVKTERPILYAIVLYSSMKVKTDQMPSRYGQGAFESFVTGNVG